MFNYDDDDDPENTNIVGDGFPLARVILEKDVIIALHKIARGAGDYLDESTIFEYLSETDISEDNEATFRQYIDEVWEILINQELKDLLIDRNYIKEAS